MKPSDWWYPSLCYKRVDPRPVASSGGGQSRSQGWVGVDHLPRVGVKPQPSGGDGCSESHRL
eukprot:764539-Hanusia_phi.AAC.14